VKLGFSTLGCPDWSEAEIAEFAAKYGFDGVELRCHTDGNHISPEATDLEIDDTKETFAAAGASVFSIAGYARFTSADAEERTSNVVEAKKDIDVASRLGAQFVRFFGGRIGERVSMDDAIAYGGECLAELGDYAEGTGVRVAMETHDDFCAAADLVRMLDAAGSDNVCACWDLHHPLNIGNEPLAKTASLLKDRTGYCHVKDAFTDTVGEGKRNIVLLGAGDMPLVKILRQLQEDGFDGFLSFEWEKKWHQEIPEPEIAIPHYAWKIRELLREI